LKAQSSITSDSYVQANRSGEIHKMLQLRGKNSNTNLTYIKIIGFPL